MQGPYLLRIQRMRKGGVYEEKSIKNGGPFFGGGGSARGCLGVHGVVYSSPSFETPNGAYLN
jgi:hypothetical protein